MRKYIITLLILACSLMMQAQEEGIMIDKVVAVVGKNVILHSDIENQIAQMKNQGAFVPGMKCNIFKGLMLQKLLLDQAQKDSLDITEAEIDANLDQRISYFINQVGSEKKLEELYGKSVTEIKEEFREMIAKQMLAERMKTELTKDFKATPTEVRRYFNKLPADSLPQIKKKYVLQQIVQYPPVDEKEKLAIKEKLRGYRARILEGEKFETLAVLYSEDMGSATHGGDLGFKGRRDFVPEFAAVAFKLKEPGDISRIVESEFGFHIIQLVEKRGELMRFKHILLKPKTSALDLMKAQNLLDSVRTQIVKKTITFEEAVEKFSSDKATNKNSGLVLNMYTGDTYFQQEHMQPAIAYMLRGVKEGELTKVFKTQDERGREVYKIIKVKEIVKPHKANLKLDYKLIQDMTLLDKQSRFMEKWVKNKYKNTYIRIEGGYEECPFLKQEWTE